MHLFYVFILYLQLKELYINLISGINCTLFIYFIILAKTRPAVEFLDIEQHEPTSIHLRWKKTDIPPFDNKDEPLLYMIESQQAPHADWHPMVSGVPTTSYHLPDLSPQYDYNFRVRALTEYGLSEPTPPVTVSRPRCK